MSDAGVVRAHTRRTSHMPVGWYWGLEGGLWFGLCLDFGNLKH
jgi:hypothetical protein